MNHQVRKYAKFIYEANAAQKWLGNEIKKQYPLLPLEPLVNSERKEIRIMRLMLLIKQGKVILSKRLNELNRQLGQYPYCAHDDLIDALAMLIGACENYSMMDIGKMKTLFQKTKQPKNPKKGFGQLDPCTGRYKKFHDPFGLLNP